MVSEAQLNPPEGKTVQMVWPRGVGSSGWRLLDGTLEGDPDPNALPYYDVKYYENWARLESWQGNSCVFVSYTYHIISPVDCWVPLDPTAQQPLEPYNVNYSYVAGGCLSPASVDEVPEVQGLDLRAAGSPVCRGSNMRVRLTLRDAGQVWLGVYGVDGRLVRTLRDWMQMVVGATDVSWDLMDVKGRRVAAGVYFVRARERAGGVGRSVAAARMIIVE